MYAEELAGIAAQLMTRQEVAALVDEMAVQFEATLTWRAFRVLKLRDDPPLVYCMATDVPRGLLLSHLCGSDMPFASIARKRASGSTDGYSRDWTLHVVSARTHSSANRKSGPFRECMPLVCAVKPGVEGLCRIPAGAQLNSVCASLEPFNGRRSLPW